MSLGGMEHMFGVGAVPVDTAWGVGHLEWGIE